MKIGNALITSEGDFLVIKVDVTKEQEQTTSRKTATISNVGYYVPVPHNKRAGLKLTLLVVGDKTDTKRAPKTVVKGYP
jgi:hypothetical protein